MSDNKIFYLNKEDCEFIIDALYLCKKEESDNSKENPLCVDSDDDYRISKIGSIEKMIHYFEAKQKEF